MNREEYFQMSPYVRTRMPGELAEIMTQISDQVVARLGEMSLLKEIAEDLPPVQAALLLSAVESPRFKLKAARKKYEVLTPLQGESVNDEIRILEEELYEKGVTAEWHIDHIGRRPSNELVVYYVNEDVYQPVNT